MAVQTRNKKSQTRMQLEFEKKKAREDAAGKKAYAKNLKRISTLLGGTGGLVYKIVRRAGTYFLVARQGTRDIAELAVGTKAYKSFRDFAAQNVDKARKFIEKAKKATPEKSKIVSKRRGKKTVVSAAKDTPKKTTTKTTAKKTTTKNKPKKESRGTVKKVAAGVTAGSAALYGINEVIKANQNRKSGAMKRTSMKDFKGGTPGDAGPKPDKAKPKRKVSLMGGDRYGTRIITDPKTGKKRKVYLGQR